MSLYQVPVAKTVLDFANSFMRLFGDTEILSSGCTETNQGCFQHFERLQLMFNVAAELLALFHSHGREPAAAQLIGESRPEPLGRLLQCSATFHVKKSFLLLKWKLLMF